MPNIQIPIVGPTYESRSKPVSSQVTRGFYMEADQNSENIVSLAPFFGTETFATPAQGVARGLGVFDNTLYAIVNQTLYSIDEGGTITTIGTVLGDGRCVIEAYNNGIVIATGTGTPYLYDGTTLTAGTDVDLPNAATATYIRNRVVYDGNNSDVVFSDLGSPILVNSANITSSDFKPDDTLAVKAFRDQLFVFGEESIVPYYNSGSGNPPYLPIQNSTSDIGIAAAYSIGANYRYMYFLGSDLMIYRISGLQPEPIGNPAIGKEIESYPDVSGAYGFCFTFNNQNFYMITFPNKATWLYTEGLGWSNLAFGVKGEPHLAFDYRYCFGKHLIQDRRNGNILQWKQSAYTDNGAIIERRRDTRKISGKEFGFPGKEIYMNRLELIVETGTGVISGQGSEPRIMMSYSDDGGRTWSAERWGYMGAMGSFEYSQNPSWTDLGSFYERQFRFRVTDPVGVTLISANAEVEVGA